MTRHWDALTDAEQESASKELQEKLFITLDNGGKIQVISTSHYPSEHLIEAAHRQVLLLTGGIERAFTLEIAGRGLVGGVVPYAR